MSMKSNKVSSSNKVGEESKRTDASAASEIELGIIKIPRVNFHLERITLPFEAPEKYLAAVTILACVFLLAGGIYDLSENPLPIGGRQSRFLAVYPGLNAQFLIESIGVAMLIAIGSFGFYVLRLSLADPENVQQSFAYMITGFLCILFGLLVLSGLLFFKLTGG